MQVDSRKIYVDRGQLAQAEKEARKSGVKLARSLLSCVFILQKLKYCSVAGKPGPESSGFKCSDGSTIVYAPLHREGVEAILGIINLLFCEFVMCLNAIHNHFQTTL